MLFDKDGFYMINDPKKNYDFAIDMFDGFEDDLYSKKEGFKNGNMFKNLYDSYRNYVPKPVVPKTKQEEMLLKIQEVDFAINDLNLYLDLHPEDKKTFKIFKDYLNECKTLKEEYSNLYGPLELSSLNDDYNWSSGIWPWEGGSY